MIIKNYGLQQMPAAHKNTSVGKGSIRAHIHQSEFFILIFKQISLFFFDEMK